MCGGGDEAWGAHDEAGLGELGVGVFGFGDSEVDELDPRALVFTAAHVDVGWLEIAVDDAGLVGDLQA